MESPNERRGHDGRSGGRRFGAFLRFSGAASRLSERLVMPSGIAEKKKKNRPVALGGECAAVSQSDGASRGGASQFSAGAFKLTFGSRFSPLSIRSPCRSGANPATAGKTPGTWQAGGRTSSAKEHQVEVRIGIAKLSPLKGGRPDGSLNIRRPADDGMHHPQHPRVAGKRSGTARSASDRGSKRVFQRSLKNRGGG